MGRNLYSNSALQLICLKPILLGNQVTMRCLQDVDPLWSGSSPACSDYELQYPLNAEFANSFSPVNAVGRSQELKRGSHRPQRTAFAMAFRFGPNPFMLAVRPSCIHIMLVSLLMGGG